MPTLPKRSQQIRGRIPALALALAGVVVLGGGAAASADSPGAARHVGVAAKTHRHAGPRSKAKSRAAQLEQLYAQRALASYAAMQRAYYNAGSGLYTGGNPYASAWSYSQATAATISVSALPGMHHQFRADLVARLQGLHVYADPSDPAPAGYESSPVPPTAAGGDRFNDDNNWIGIELLRLYHVDRNPSLLSSADQIFAMVRSQWDQNGADQCTGGVPWRSFDPASQRNTVSNATGAELGAQLFITTHSAADLEAAQRMYAWVRGCLLNADGLYADHIAADGFDATEWTYNQGTMIGAGVMLYQATGDRSYLDQALATGRAALHTYSGEMLANQGDGFNAIYIRNLLLLGAASGDPRYATFARWYANDSWANVRDPASNLFRSGPGGDTSLIDQAAMVQVFALLAEPISAYF